MIETIKDYDYKAANRSARVMQNLIFPKMFGDGRPEVIVCEGSNDPALFDLDYKYGIDYIINKENIGARICYKKNWATFTIRMNRNATSETTEFEKLRLAIKNNSLRPQYTIQAFVSEDEKTILSYAVIETDKLINFMQTDYLFNRGQNLVWRESTDKRGTSEFVAIRFEALRAAGIKVLGGGDWEGVQ